MFSLNRLWIRYLSNSISIPYYLQRTLLSKRLPIYSKYTHGESKVVTILRHVEGDFDALKQELLEILPNNPLPKIRVRKDIGQIRINGHHVSILEEYFAKRGL